MNGNNAFTLSDLTGALKKQCRITSRDAAMVSSAVFSILAAAVAKQKTVRITGFGTFSVKDRAGKNAFNVRTRQPAAFPPYKTVSFRPCRAIKNALNTTAPHH